MAARKRKYHDDPLVPFDAERIRAAVEQSGQSVASLAAALRIPQPTLHMIVSGSSRRCRASLLAKLSKRLRVVRPWLEGKADAGPFERQQALAAEAQGTTFEPWEQRRFMDPLPPLAKLRAATLVEGILQAWERDLAAGVAPPPPPETVLGRVWEGMDITQRRVWIGAWLEGLVSLPDFYRPFAYALPERIDASNADVLDWLETPDQALTTALTEALQRLLGPWLDGERRLNYGAAYAFLEALAQRSRKLSKSIDKHFFIRRVLAMRDEQRRAASHR